MYNKNIMNNMIDNIEYILEYIRKIYPNYEWRIDRDLISYNLIMSCRLKDVCSMSNLPNEIYNWSAVTGFLHIAEKLTKQIEKNIIESYKNGNITIPNQSPQYMPQNTIEHIRQPEETDCPKEELNRFSFIDLS